MPRRNRTPRIRRSQANRCFDRDYVSLPEYPQYTTILALPLKTVFVNLDAGPRANDFYVATHYGDKVLKKIAKKLEAEVIA